MLYLSVSDEIFESSIISDTLKAFAISGFIYKLFYTHIILLHCFIL